MRSNFILFLLLFISTVHSQWMKESVTDSYMYHIEEFDGRLFAFGDSVIFRKSNGIWDSLIVHGHNVNAISALYVKGNDILVGTANDGIFHTTDAGFSWRRYSAGLSGAGLSIINFAERGDYIYAATSGAGVYATNKNFQSAWEPQNAGLSFITDYSINCIKNINGTLWISVGGNGYVFHRAEGAQVWTGMYITDILPEVTIFSRIESIGNYIYFAGKPGLYYSSDNGLSWHKTNGINSSFYPVLKKINNMLFYSALSANGGGTVYNIIPGTNAAESLFISATYSTGAVELYENKIYMTAINGLYSRDFVTTDIIDGVNLNSFSISNFYPNPFNGSGFFSINIPVSGRVSIDVYDVAGKLVLQDVNYAEAGEQKQIQFNSGTLSSGTYFLRVRSGDKFAVQKIVLMK